MISTPICDFTEKYARQEAVRLHMPGHKGKIFLGCESRDITEIDGADDLYHADGIIAESEANASSLFGCPTFYSTEGSSLCIRAMLFLAMTASGEQRPLVLAGRNAHKTFLTAAVLLDFEIGWMFPSQFHSYHACSLTAEDVERYLTEAQRKPCAVYLTSPDYLGNMADIRSIAAVCKKHSVLLLVDNAHGAYLRFLSHSLHPMDLGADLCCDSAHKTLNVLTGGAYLHVKDPALARRAKEALALFGSTSPSYLIMQSLDQANPAMELLPRELDTFLPKVEYVKQQLTAYGYSLCGEEPLKITIQCKPFGHTGIELAKILAAKQIICEFCDPDYLVLMVTPANSASDLQRLTKALCSLPSRQPIEKNPPAPGSPIFRMHPRQAVFAPHEDIPVQECLGRIIASAAVSCPPAIPIVMCGEEIDQHALDLFRYYGIQQCTVVK